MSAIDLALRPVVDEARRCAAPADIDRWLKAARAGDRLHYATQPYLPAGSTGARHLRVLEERGLVMLVQKRSDLLAGEFCYFAIRTSRPIGAAPSHYAQRAVLAPRGGAEGDQAAADLVLPLLARAAQFGRPCPSDKQLAARAGIALDRVEGAFRALTGAREIVVHAASAPTLRRVTILSTGARTGLMA